MIDEVPTLTRGGKFRISLVIGPLFVFAAFLGLWEYMHRDGLRRFFDKPGRLLPSPATVAHTGFGKAIFRNKLWTGLGWTMYTSFIGLGIAIVIGIMLAVVMARALWVERSLFPYLVALQAMPVLAMITLIYTVFGGGVPSRLFVCVMISLFPIVTNTLFGLTTVDSTQHDLFTLRSAGAFTRLFKLQFPAAMPAIFTGFRISAGLSVIGAIVGEQFFRQGAKPGLGMFIDQFRNRGQWPALYADVILSSILGVAVFFAFDFIGRLVVGHWHEATRRGS
jgi:NitT/TauT family transport system permease protein